MKKTLSVLLALSMLISLCSSLLISNAAEMPTIEIENFEAHPGDTVSVPLVLKNNPGIAGLTITVNIDENVFTLKEVKNGNLFSSVTAAKNIIWSSDSNITGDGTLAILELEVSADASLGNSSIEIIIRSCVNAEFATVECNAENGSVTVKEEPVPLSGIKLNKNSLSLNIDENETLTPVFTPDNATNKKVLWTSSDNSVATVSDNGLVTGIKKGTAVITVKSEDGEHTASCEITVNCIHEWSETSEAKYLKTPANCVSKAVYYKSCCVCGEKGSDTFETGEINPNNHTGKIRIENDLKESCTEDGYTGDKYCLDCNIKIEDGKVIPAAHSLIKKEAVASTETNEGNIEYYECSVCKKLFNNQNADKEISIEDTVLPKHIHSYGEWIVLKDSTENAVGIKERTCFVCGNKETSEIPVKISDDINKPKPPTTADTNTAFAWFIFIIAVTGLSVSIYWYKNKVANS